MATKLIKNFMTTAGTSVITLGLIGQQPNDANAQDGGSSLPLLTESVKIDYGITIDKAIVVMPGGGTRQVAAPQDVLATICVSKVRLDRETNCELVLNSASTDCEQKTQSIRLSPHFFDNTKDPRVFDVDDKAARLGYSATFNTACTKTIECTFTTTIPDCNTPSTITAWNIGDRVKLEVGLSSNGTRKFLAVQRDLEEDDPDKAHPCNRNFKPEKRVNITRYQQSRPCDDVRSAQNEAKIEAQTPKEAFDRFSVAMDLADKHLETADAVWAESRNLIRDMNLELRTFYRQSRPKPLQNRKITYRQRLNYVPFPSRRQERRKKFVEIMNRYVSRIDRLNKDADSMKVQLENLENYIKTFTLLNPGTRLGGAVKDAGNDEILRDALDRSRAMQDEAIRELNYVRDNQDIKTLRLFITPVQEVQNLLPQYAYFPRVRESQERATFRLVKRITNLVRK